MAISAAAPTRIAASAITNPTSSLANHTMVLGQLKESVEVGQRLRGNVGDSYVRASELVSALGARIVNGTIQPPTPGAAVTVAVTNSITGTGVSGSPLELSGDVSAPGNNMIYGTSSGGVKGWYAAGSVAPSTLSVTDGTHNVAAVTAITVAGAVVSGTSPHAVITITSSSGISGIGPPGLDGNDGADGERGAPGSTGATGAQGIPGPAVFLESEADIQEPLHVPGPQGIPGPVSQGPQQFVFLTDHELPDDPSVIPGQTGQSGQIGQTGQAGAAGMPGLDGDPGDEGMPVPGPQGPPGAAIQGPPGPAVFLESEADVQEPLHVPGPQGPSGSAIQGPAGPAIFLESEADVQEPLHVPGPQGLQGTQGVPGTGGTGSGYEILYHELVPEENWAPGVGTIYPGGALTVGGPLTVLGSARSLVSIVDSGTSSTTQFSLSAVNDTNGANIALTGNGATAPSKFIRVQGGNLQVINNAYSAAIFAIGDAGNTTINCSSGVALTVDGSGATQPVAIAAGASNPALSVDSTATTGPYQFFTRSSTSFAFIGNSGALGGTLDNLGLRGQTGIDFITNGGAHLAGTISTNGSWNIPAPTSGNALNVTGVSGSYGTEINGSSTASNSYGLLISAGTNSSDIALNVINQAATINYLIVRGDGSGELGPSGATGLSWNAAGNIVIGSPSSGAALTINEPNNTSGLIYTSNSQSVALGVFGSTASFGTTTAAALSLSTNGLARVTIASSGAVSVAPTSGTALTVTGISGTAPDITLHSLSMGDNVAFAAGSNIYSTAAFQLGTTVATTLTFFTNNLSRMAVSSAGGVIIATPTSGDTLTVAPSVTSGALMATSAALTTGAGTSAGTLTNAPSIGNPTKWIKINDNGTIRSIPAW